MSLMFFFKPSYYAQLEHDPDISAWRKREKERERKRKKEEKKRREDEESLLALLLNDDIWN